MACRWPRPCAATLTRPARPPSTVCCARCAVVGRASPGAWRGALTPSGPRSRLRTWREWTGVAPGALQGDLVLHCGESTAGLYCATLVAVDVATTWTELQPIWGLHQQRVTGGIQHIAQRLPFPLRRVARDNGREFVNACLLGWCQRHGSASPGAGPIARTTRPGSSSAMASSSAASSGTIAIARGPPGPFCSASTACSACSTTSFARCGNS